MKRIAFIAIAALAVTGCDPQPESADKKQGQATEKMQGEAVAQVGMPAIVNFSEMRDAKENYELRDKPQATITYIVDLNGKLHKLCDSVGYGLPYGVQYSNPQKIAASSHNVGYAILPQAEPNGLFMPASADGTWVKCLDPFDKTMKTVYIEPRVIVSPFPLGQ